MSLDYFRAADVHGDGWSAGFEDCYPEPTPGRGGASRSAAI